MGNDLSAAITKNREIIRQARKKSRILLIGEQGNGKSSLIDTIYSAVTEHRSFVAPVGAIGNEEQRETTRFKKYDCGNVILYDCPGMRFLTPTQMRFLEVILKGIEDDQELPLKDDKIQKKLDQGAIREDPDNQIDFVIWVLNGSLLERNKKSFLGFFKGATLDSSGRHYYETIWEVIKNSTRTHQKPFLVFTHKDELYNSPQALVTNTFEWLSTTNKWVIANYLKAGDKNDETDYTATELISTIVARLQNY